MKPMGASTTADGISGGVTASAANPESGRFDTAGETESPEARAFHHHLSSAEPMVAAGARAYSPTPSRMFNPAPERSPTPGRDSER